MPQRSSDPFTMALATFQAIDYGGLLLAGGLLILSVLFFISYRKQRQRIQSGQELARGSARNEHGRLVVDLPFHVAHSNTWHRIAAHFDLAAESKEGLVEHLELTQHRFTLSLRNGNGGIIVSETRPLQDFAMFSISRSKVASLMIGAESTWRCQPDGVPMLEFVPPHPGDYRVTVEVAMEEAMTGGRFEYKSRLQNFAISVREDVLPMTSRAYPHKKLDLRSPCG